MESDSLHSLKLLLNEDLYLVPEEIDQILSPEKTEPRKEVK